MFRRGKSKEKPVANKLSRQSEPNKLSWTDADSAPGEELEEQDLLDEDELEDEDEELEYDEDEEEAEDPEEQTRRKAELEAELARQAEEFGLTGANPTAAYGSNGQQVAALLDRLERLGPDQLENLADAWDAVEPAERDVVYREIARQHRDGRHRDELAAAEQMVTDWLNASTGPTVSGGEAQLVRVAADAATDAVDALILAGDLDDSDFNTLYGPWDDAIGSTDDDDVAAEEPEEETGEFGPNTELVGVFLERLEELDPIHLAELATAWNEVDKGDLRHAHKAVKALAEEDGAWRDQVRAAQQRVTDWAARPHPPRMGKKGALIPPDPEAVQAAIPAAVDAITALVLADLLEPEDADALYVAWEDVVGEPALPEFEDDEEDGED